MIAGGLRRCISRFLGAAHHQERAYKKGDRDGPAFHGCPWQERFVDLVVTPTASCARPSCADGVAIFEGGEIRSARGFGARCSNVSLSLDGHHVDVIRERGQILLGASASVRTEGCGQKRCDKIDRGQNTQRKPRFYDLVELSAKVIEAYVAIDGGGARKRQRHLLNPCGNGFGWPCES